MKDVKTKLTEKDILKLAVKIGGLIFAEDISQNLKMMTKDSGHGAVQTKYLNTKVYTLINAKRSTFKKMQDMRQDF